MTEGRVLSILFSCAIMGLAFIIPLITGPFIIRNKNKNSNFLNTILGFPAGAFLANACINLIPEVFSTIE